MEIKKCCMCKTEKDLTIENFAWKNQAKGTFSSQCRTCQKAYRKKHYEENKDKYKKKARFWSNNQADEFFRWLAKQKCQDCGISDIRVLEFDHVRGEKKESISVMLRNASRQKLQEEIEKCDIVCANCHRIRTAAQFNYYSRILSLDG